jgi:DNA mismatch repair protein MLH1
MLYSLPEIIRGYVPDLSLLPLVLLRLATDVDYDSPSTAMATIAQHLASLFFVPSNVPSSSTSILSSSSFLPMPDSRWSHHVQNMLLPQLFRGLRPPSQFANDGTVARIASLEEFYKVFERC